MNILRELLKAFFRPLIRPAVNDIVLKDHRLWGEPSRLRIQPTAVVNNALFNTASGRIDIGDHVFFGHNVCILTGTHDITETMEGRKQAVPDSGHDVVVGKGAWIGSNAIVLGPCVIGEHAVVAAGSVVTRDVAEYTVVGGNPARVIRNISPKSP